MPQTRPWFWPGPPGMQRRRCRGSITALNDWRPYAGRGCRGSIHDGIPVSGCNIGRCSLRNVAVQLGKLLQGLRAEDDAIFHRFLTCSAARRARTWSAVTARDGSAFKASWAGPSCLASQFSTARSRATSARSPSRLPLRRHCNCHVAVIATVTSSSLRAKRGNPRSDSSAAIHSHPGKMDGRASLAMTVGGERRRDKFRKAFQDRCAVAG